jgi:hypothetical protein
LFARENWVNFENEYCLSLRNLNWQDHHHSAKLLLSGEWEDALYPLSENYQLKEKEGLTQRCSERSTAVLRESMPMSHGFQK